MVGWCNGAGQLLVPGHPSNLDNGKARAFCACSRWGLWLFRYFFSYLSFLFSFFQSLGDGQIQTEILSQRT